MSSSLVVEGFANLEELGRVGIQCRHCPRLDLEAPGTGFGEDEAGQGFVVTGEAALLVDRLERAGGDQGQAALNGLPG